MAINTVAQIPQDVSSLQNTGEKTVACQHYGNIQHKEAIQGIKEDKMKNLQESKESIQNIQEDIRNIRQVIQVIKEDMKKNAKESEQKVDRRIRQIAGQSGKYILFIIFIMVMPLAYFTRSYILDNIEDLNQKTQELDLKTREHDLKTQELNLHLKMYSYFSNTVRTFEMKEFSKEKKKDKPRDWKSPPMYTHTFGYKFCMGLDANGRDGACGKALYAELYVMPGKYDGLLKWPAKASFTLELIHQKGGANIKYNTAIKKWDKPKLNFEFLSFFPRTMVNKTYSFIEHSQLKKFIVKDSLKFSIDVTLHLLYYVARHVIIFCCYFTFKT